MPTVLNPPSLWRRLLPLAQGLDWWLIATVAWLCGIGLVVMYSSGYDHGMRFAEHARNMALAAGIMLVIAQVPPRRLMNVAAPAYVLGMALLVAVALFGITKKGATRWLNLGVVVQPSELLKIATPLMLAWWFQRRETLTGRVCAIDFMVACGLLVLPVALIMKQPDLGTALLVMAAGLAAIFFAGLPWKLTLPPVVLGIVAVALCIAFQQRLCATGVHWPILHDYQQQRVCTLLDPTSDPLGKGFHVLQGMIAIGSGGMWGKGFMHGTQTHLNFVPEGTTDFIFAAYGEEFGLMGNLALIAGFSCLIGRALFIAASAPTLFTRLLAASLITIFFAYAFVNMGMVSGILPVVGVPLPFISYGGTAMVTLGLAIGMLLAISKMRRLMPN
ncbi:MAG: rod shape-determining protein RodA [Burkholderiaceae bacterium]|jgi:rod shape determining protein RodA|nr:rod shape-determining protein RodA [Burkholderiaceae bacterium]